MEASITDFEKCSSLLRTTIKFVLRGADKSIPNAAIFSEKETTISQDKMQNPYWTKEMDLNIFALEKAMLECDYQQARDRHLKYTMGDDILTRRLPIEYEVDLQDVSGFEIYVNFIDFLSSILIEIT